MTVSFTDKKHVRISSDNNRKIRVRDLYHALGKLPNGAVITELELQKHDPRDLLLVLITDDGSFDD